MNKFWNAMATNDESTENGMPTHSTSGSFIVDLFYKMGGSRQNSEQEIINWFIKAYEESPLYAVRSMFYNRDIRGGQGERRSFRTMLKWMAVNHPEEMNKYLHFVPEYGRWDDLFVVFGTSLETHALDMIREALLAGDGLCAKWMPRENKKNHKIAATICWKMGLSWKNYRQLLVSCTKVVETIMCQNEWQIINYSQVPSIASSKYKKAFWKHDADRYSKWVERAKKGEVKVNASAIFPHNIIHSIMNERNTVILDSAVAQWQNLPDYVGEGSFIPVCDTSGSMWGEPMEVCVALGIYLSERNKSVFKDGFITFSSRPELQILKGNLVQRISQLSTAAWGMNTDVEAVFKLILRQAVQYNLKPEDMPKNILIISDMQFDACVANADDNAITMIERMYEKANYVRPNIIFWNLRTSTGVPVKIDKNGTALVSGFSPSIMKNLLSAKGLTPLDVVKEVLDSPRYSVIE